MTTSTLPSHNEREILTRVYRKIHDEFPEFSRDLLNQPLKRNLFQNIMLGLLKHADEHTLSQCIVRVSKSGYTVTRGTGEEPRRTGTYKSSDTQDESRPVRSGSQCARILAAYWNAGEEGLTADEAQEQSKVSERSCYWKRVSELQHGGYIEHVDGVTRPGRAGAKQRVLQITPLGSETCLSLL